MLKEKIKKAENSIPSRGGFKAQIEGKIIAVLRDENGNVKDYREVDI